jgi:ribosomal protein S12 methylthiotransferase
LQQWREQCPELVIRSTFIAGFPGETEAEFQHLLGFLAEAQIDRAGCFAYSPVEGATANELPGMLPENCAKSVEPGSWKSLKRYPFKNCNVE